MLIIVCYLKKKCVELARPKIESRDPIFFTSTRSRSRVSGNDRLFLRGSEFGPNPETPASPLIQLRPRPGHRRVRRGEEEWVSEWESDNWVRKGVSEWVDGCMGGWVSDNDWLSEWVHPSLVYTYVSGQLDDTLRLVNELSSLSATCSLWSVSKV